MDWRTLALAELEREYSPSSAIGGNYQPFIAQYIDLSAVARARFLSLWRGQASWDIPYDDAPTQTLDLFFPANHHAHKPPLLVFIHGGYWQELSKNESSFAAIDAVQAGWAYAVLDYTLAPAASVAQMVEECKQAIGFLYHNADHLGFDAQRIVVAGSSAGAHLAAMAALGEIALPNGQTRSNLIKATVLVSGIFELEPLIVTTVNAALSLDKQSAKASSPMQASAAVLAGFPPACIVWGEIETEQFKEQSRTFAQALAIHGVSASQLEIPERNHFDVVLDLCKPNTPLGDAVLAFLALIAPNGAAKFH